MAQSARRFEESAKAFWKAAGGRKKYGRPVDLERAVVFALPIGICRMPELSTAKVAAVLERIGTVPWSASPDRPLSGCLVADVGVGLVFLDGGDPPDERRYSLAHEIAHFLLHYLQPRQQVLEQLGHAMVAVLDRARPPTDGERLSSALRNVALEPFRHAIARDPDRSVSYLRTRSMEGEADDLALEILAPLVELRGRDGLTPHQLAIEFGLPPYAAARLAQEIVPQGSGGVISIFKK
jgi:IrrE N-terminal-like domain